VGETELQKEVRLANRRDKFAKEMKQNIQNGAKSHFQLQNGLLKECHDGLLASHGGAKRSTSFFKKSYYWPNLKDDAEEYVKTCLIC
jgi:hypothetical protein